MTDPAAKLLEGIDPFSPRFQQDPFPFYAAMRDTSPAWHLPGSDLRFVTRYDLVGSILRDTTTFSSKFGNAAEPPPPHLLAELRAIADQGWPRVSTLLTADPPKHTRYRSTVAKAFNARAIAALRPDIELIVDEVIDDFIGGQRADMQTAFATPVPVQVIARALNLPRDRGDDIKRWSDDATAAIGTDLSDERRLEAQRGILELQRFMHDAFEERRRQPQSDVLTTLLEARLPGAEGEPDRPLNDGELLSILQQLLGAGNETTTKLLNEMVKLLGEDHDEWWKVKADPSRAPLVVEESLRLASPTQGMFRVVTTDTEIDGVPIPAGSRVVLVFAAANRDPAVFPDPDRFLPDRPNVRDHVAFGLGIHFCIGAPLSRLESVIALEKLTQRWEDFRLTEENTFLYHPSFMLRGLEHLFVEFTRAE